MFGEVEPVPFEFPAPPPSPEPRRRRILPWKLDADPPAPPPPSPCSVVHALLHARPYRNPKLLPKSFRAMRSSFARDGVADLVPFARRMPGASRDARSATRPRCILTRCGTSPRRGASARSRRTTSTPLAAHYNAYATTMAFVFGPFLEDNEDGIDVHDFGGPLSDYGHGAVGRVGRQEPVRRRLRD